MSQENPGWEKELNLFLPYRAAETTYSRGSEIDWMRKRVSCPCLYKGTSDRCLHATRNLFVYSLIAKVSCCGIQIQNSLSLSHRQNVNLI